MNNPYFGWELLFKLIECDVSSAEDIMVALVHWQLIQLGFSCLGRGDDKVVRENECGTEKLPEGWNSDCEHYSLRYVLGCDVYILNCVIIDKSTALFNLYNVCKTTVSNVSFELREVITYCADSPKKRLLELVQNIDVQIQRIRGELIMPVAGCQCCTTETADRHADPKPFPRVPGGEFHCVPNVACGNNWPPNMGFEMPNRQLLLPPSNCCPPQPQNQCADAQSMCQQKMA